MCGRGTPACARQAAGGRDEQGRQSSGGTAAAGLTGTLRLIWQIGDSIVSWAVRLVFSPVVWLGLVVAGVAVAVVGALGFEVDHQHVDDAPVAESQAKLPGEVVQVVVAHHPVVPGVDVQLRAEPLDGRAVQDEPHERNLRRRLERQVGPGLSR